MIFQVHVGATLALVGLIWTVQLVHYPLMAEVRTGFARYHELHRERITWIVAPLMGAEALGFVREADVKATVERLDAVLAMLRALTRDKSA